jgi:hypothetical protein
MEQKQAAKEKREIYMEAPGYEIMRMIKCPLANRDEIPYFAKGKAHPAASIGGRAALNSIHRCLRVLVYFPGHISVPTISDYRPWSLQVCGHRLRLKRPHLFRACPSTSEKSLAETW